MFCNQCGAQLEEGAAFCNNCGARADGGQEENNIVTSASQKSFSVNFPKDGSLKSILFYAMLASSTLAILFLFFQEWISVGFGNGFRQISRGYVLMDGDLLSSNAAFWVILAIMTSLAAIGSHALVITELIFGRKLLNIKNIKTTYISAAVTTLTFLFVVFACITLAAQMGGYVNVGPTFTGYLTLILTAGNVACEILRSKN